LWRLLESTGVAVKPSRPWFGSGRTETGHVRPTNQDAFAVINDCMVWVVADGMGGHPAGDLAARTAVASLARMAPHQFGDITQKPDDPSRLLADLLVAANREITEQSAAQPMLKGMGTTVVAMAITLNPQPIAHIAHLGDSRAYLYREGHLLQLTRDHTLVEEYLRSGLINAAEARVHPKRHVLTQALGMELDRPPERTSIALEPNDVLLLCSDGLTKMLADEEITRILSHAEGQPIRACNVLIEEALMRGGEDNVTVIVCTPTAPTLSMPPGH
jgi:protein phosphatase